MAADHSDGLWSAALCVSAWAAGMPADIGLAILGAGVLVGRFLAEQASGLFPRGDGAPTARHDVEKVRERARAAQQAARASGLLSRRRR
jgi:hypothetical protein